MMWEQMHSLDGKKNPEKGVRETWVPPLDLTVWFYTSYFPL